MKISGVLKPALFVYECVRLILFLFLLFIYKISGSITIPWLAFSANGALFPLMALFIWIDISRYRQYVPLFIAGKCIGVLLLILWLLLFIQSNIIETGVFFLCGDLLALASVVFILKEKRTLEEAESKKLTNRNIEYTEADNADNSDS